MVFDTRTMFLLLCLGNLTMFFMLLTFGKATKIDGLFKRYAYAKLFQGLGTFIISDRDIIPEWLTVVVGDSLLFFGIILETFCFIYVEKIPSYKAVRSWIRLSVVVAIGFILAYLAGAGPFARSAVVSAVVSAAAFTIAVTLLFCSNETVLRRVTGAFFAGLSLTYAFQAMKALLNNESYVLYNAASGQTLSLLPSYVYMLISAMAFLLLSREAIDLKLQQAATRDFLTGIYNRRHCQHLAKNLFGQMICRQQPISVLMLDLDRFKLINDKYGHFVGDEVLVHFSEVVSAVLCSDDIFGRYGGEEFIIFLPNTGRQGAAAIGQKIRLALAKALTSEPALPNYTVSIGTATVIPEQVADVAKLMKMADTALFQAKRNGRNRVIQYNV